MRTPAAGPSGVRVVEPDGTAAEPVWFGRPEAPLFGWVHRPARPAMGSVVLCPPLFSHAAPAHHPYRVLARRLAASGLAVVRFDYQGTGDSAGELAGPGVVDAWLGSVRSAVELARSSASGPLGLVGLRMGALLAAVAADRTVDVDALALWDPPPSGRAFLRQQQALLAMRSAGGHAAGVVEVPGALLDAVTAAEVAGLRLPAAAPGSPSLVLLRHEQPPGAAPWHGATGGPVRVERLSKGEQESFLEVDPLDREVPWDALDRLTGWLCEVLRTPGTDVAARTSPVRSPWTANGPVRIAARPAGASLAVTERAVRLGPLGLFGIETVASEAGSRTVGGDGPREGGVVVFLSSGADCHTGPSRLWVALARQWAGEGFRCVRVDLSGLGDSPARPGQAEDVVRPPEAFDDVRDVVASVADDPRRVVLVGLCSGAYQALESALELGTLGVLGVNPALRFTPPEVADGGAPSPRRRIAVARPAWMGTARSRLPERAGTWLGAARKWWRRHHPCDDDGWKADLVERGVQVYCLCGEAEARPMLPAGARALAQCGSSDDFVVDVMEGLDHALLAHAHREMARERLTERLHRMVGCARSTPVVTATGSGRRGVGQQEPEAS